MLQLSHQDSGLSDDYKKRFRDAEALLKSKRVHPNKDIIRVGRQLFNVYEVNRTAQVVEWRTTGDLCDCKCSYGILGDLCHHGLAVSQILNRSREYITALLARKPKFNQIVTATSNNGGRKLSQKRKADRFSSVDATVAKRPRTEQVP